MFEIEIANRQPFIKISASRLRGVVQHVLRAEGIDRASISVAVVDDDTIQAVHRRYLQEDTPTDVLSFPLSHGPERLEGEVLVNAEHARRVARRYRCSPQKELLLYLVHGLLHLCGYDDHADQEARQMRRRQRQLLRGLQAQTPGNGRSGRQPQRPRRSPGEE